jgi:two-component system, cell cycle sensor histidine kinase and response regulator CckA
LSESTPASDIPQIRPAATNAGAILLVHQGGRITHANQAAHLLWHAKSGELAGELFSNLFAPKEPPSPGEAQPDLWLLINGASLDQDVPVKVRRPNGSQPVADTAAEVTVRVERLADIIYVATVHAATAPEIAVTPAANVAPANHPALSSSDSNLAPLLQHGGVGFFDLDAKTGRATYSPTWKRMLGYADTSFPDTIEAWRALIHPDDSSAAPDKIGKRTSTAPRPFNVEFRMRHQGGHWIWVQSVGVQLLSATGELERVIGLNLDISERKEIEEATLTGDERLELLGAGSLGIFDLDFSHQTFWFSPGWRTILGYREHELVNELATFVSSLPPDERSTGVEAWIRARSPDLSTFVNRELLMGKDGERIPVHFGMHQVLTRKRELARVVGFISPLSSTSESDVLPPVLIQQALAALAEAIIVTNSAGKIVFINPAACRMLRVKPEEVQDKLASHVFRLVQRDSGLPAEDPVTRAISERDPLPQVTDSALPPRNPGEIPQPIIWTARVARDPNHRPQGVIILFRDPAEISLTPDELLKANRLESLGMVAGGIAHDFNDLLTTILGGISLAKEKQSSGALEESEKACLSAKSLTKQLLTFAKGGSISHSVISAEEVLNASIKLASAGSDAAITIDVAEGTEPVRVDRLQMTQVFQNLIINALQAMPAPPHRPQIQLRAANATLAENQIPPLPAGAYVEFEIRDNANGIVPENVEKIFDPFFTTRKHGTGLGLATALGIVRKHGGQIGVVSTLGEGTAFTIFLPRADSPAMPDAQKAPSLRFRTGRILFMDDDPRITALTATMLESLDYKFDVAKDGAEALQLYQRYFNIGRPYDAVILDVTVVGGMGGEECFKHLRDCDPEIRAIISTGYDNDATARGFLDRGFCGYLTKPYRVAELGKVLKAVLG